MIKHWVTVVAGEEKKSEVFRRAVQWIAALFYAGGGLLASPRTDHLQEELDVLTGIFDRFGLRTNMKKW